MKRSCFSFVLLIALYLIVPDQTAAQSGYYITGADETELHVQEYGEGEPVVLLSGGPLLNATYLEDLWEHLGSRFRWIVLHQRGTGNSLVERPDSTSFTVKNYVGDLEALRNELGLGQLTLVGHSWGGMLAMEYAAHHPDRINKMVLLGPGGPTSNFMQYFNDNINLRLHDSDRAEMARLRKEGRAQLPGFFPGYFYNRSRALQIKETTDFESWYGQTQFRAEVLKSFFATAEERLQLLKSFTGPVHVIQGRQDPIGVSTAYEIQDAMPQTEITFIEQAGHLPWLEGEQKAEYFFDILSESLAMTSN